MILSNGNRAGFFIGDAAGVGKGRQVKCQTLLPPAYIFTGMCLFTGGRGDAPGQNLGYPLPFPYYFSPTLLTAGLTQVPSYPSGYRPESPGFPPALEYLEK